MSLGSRTVHLLNKLPGFDRRYATENEVHAAARFHRASAPIRVALLSNPMAQTNWRSVGHERLLKHMPDPHLCVSTPSPVDIEWSLDYLLLQKHANVLVINGGDGTIHHTLNALFSLLDEQRRRFDVSVPPPRLLFVNGGGMNMLARVFKTRGHPGTLRRFLKLSSGRTLGQLNTLNVPLLKASHENGARYGFIFGSELVHNALELYERFGRGYRGLTRFFTELGKGYVMRNEMWHTFGHLIEPPRSQLEVNGRIHDMYGAFVASTVPMTLALGSVRTFTKHPPRGRLNTVTVSAREPTSIISTIPFLMLGSRGPGFQFSTDVTSARLSGSYTLDGELFSHERQYVSISLSEWEIEGVVL